MPTPALTPNYIVGKAVAVSVGGALTYNKGGSLTRNANQIKVTNARSLGYQQLKTGVKGAQLSLDLVYNGDDPPAIFEGQEITVIFDAIGYDTAESIPNPATTPAGRLITGQFNVGSIKDTWQTEGDYGWSLDAASTGAYTAVESATGLTTTT